MGEEKTPDRKLMISAENLRDHVQHIHFDRKGSRGQGFERATQRLRKIVSLGQVPLMEFQGPKKKEVKYSFS